MLLSGTPAVSPRPSQRTAKGFPALATTQAKIRWASDFPRVGFSRARSDSGATGQAFAAARRRFTGLKDKVLPRVHGAFLKISSASLAAL